MNTWKIADDLQSGDVLCRRAAAEYCAQHGVEPACLTALIGASSDPDETVREWVVSALEGMDGPDAGSVEQLRGMLNSSEENVAYWAATLLGRLGEVAAQASANLGDLVSGDSPIAVRQRAAWALGQIGPAAKCALVPLRRAVESDDPRLARLARTAMQSIGGL
jgi:HEAT repeat protein